MSFLLTVILLLVYKLQKLDARYRHSSTVRQRTLLAVLASAWPSCRRCLCRFPEAAEWFRCRRWDSGWNSTLNCRRVRDWRCFLGWFQDRHVFELKEYNWFLQSVNNDVVVYVNRYNGHTDTESKTIAKNPRRIQMQLTNTQTYTCMCIFKCTNLDI